MQILEHLQNRCNADANLYFEECDEYGNPILRPMPMSGDFRLSISGNRISACRVRQANAGSFDSRKRENIRGLSKSASYRMAKYLREVVCDLRTLVTLTFENPPSGEAAKRALDVFIKRLQRQFNHQVEFSGFWFLEFQSRGAIHFHLFLSFYVPKDWLSQAWRESVADSGKNFTNVKSIKSGRHGTISYAQKYAVKQSQKQVPPDFGWVGRMWGKFGNTAMAAAGVIINFDRLNEPVFAQKVKKLSDFFAERRAKKQAYYREVQRVDKETNEVKSAGVHLWELNNTGFMRKLVQLFNELIEDEGQKLPYPRGWAKYDKQIRPSSAV